MEPKTADLDHVGTLRAVEDRLQRRRQAEVDDLELAVHWAGMHAEDPRDWPAERQHRGMQKLVQLGGEGTPEVQDLCLAELGTARHSHPLAARAHTADGLDLVYRLPKSWAVTQALVCEPWVARRVASMTRHLSQEEAAYVDRAVAAAMLGEQPSVVLGICGAKIVEANPAKYQERLETEGRRKYVALGKMGDAGLRTVIAQIDAGDAVYVDAVVARVADIFHLRDAAAGREARGRDERRAAAFGMLARPAELLALLIEHAGDPDLPDPADPEPEPERDGPDQPGPDSGGAKDPGDAAADGQAAPADPDGEALPDPGPMPTPEPEQDPDAEVLAAGRSLTRTEDECARSDPDAEPGTAWLTGLPSAYLAAFRAIDPAELRPRAQLYLHLHQAALASSSPGGVVNVEDAGPCLPTDLARLLGDTLVKVTEVIDLNGSTPLSTYVHPQWLKDQVQLISPRTCFPHSTTISRKVDYDHPDPYRHGARGQPAPPGQTGLHNAGPLGRYQHRVKTHANWGVREPQPGTYVWRTPHHLYRLVDPDGTRVLDEQTGRAVFATDDKTEQLRLLQDLTDHGADRAGQADRHLTIVTAEEVGVRLEVADDYPGRPGAA